MSNVAVQRHSRIPSISRMKPQPLSREAAALACVILLMMLAWLYCCLEDSSG
jgi:hypothetical protein